MKTKWLVVIGIALAVILVVGLAGVGGWLLRDTIWRAVADSRFGPALGAYGWGPGMMGSYGRGPGMMGGYGSDWSGEADELFPCCDWDEAPTTTEPGNVTIEDAQEAVEEYVAGLGYQGLEVHEVMEFTLNFYAIVEEEDTGIGAMELLIDKETGEVGPEYGPNMMWNAKYGMHGGGRGPMMGGVTSGEMTVSEDEALLIAQRWLDEYRPGTVTESHADPFYGYYTIHTLRDGQISGMLSVHGSTGQVWYHNWHGDFVQMIEEEEGDA
jgi:hypothetical protein